MLAFPLHLTAVVLDARVAGKGDELRFQRGIQMHGHVFPIAAVAEIETESAGLVIGITAPVLNAYAAEVIRIAVHVSYPLARVVVRAALFGWRYVGQVKGRLLALAARVGGSKRRLACNEGMIEQVALAGWAFGDFPVG